MQSKQIFKEILEAQKKLKGKKGASDKDKKVAKVTRIPKSQ